MPIRREILNVLNAITIGHFAVSCDHPYFFVNKTVNRGVKNRYKFLIYIGKVVVGGKGLEPVPIVSYLVIKCHKVSYLYGYDGLMWSYLVTNIHIVLNVLCGRIVGRTRNFVGRIISYVFKTFLCL